MNILNYKCSDSIGYWNIHVWLACNLLNIRLLQLFSTNILFDSYPLFLQVPSPPLAVKARPYGFNSLEVTWSPPIEFNGQLEVYVAFTLRPRRQCFSDDLQHRRCYLHDIPANSTLEVYVFACTLSNIQQQGGGCGDSSDKAVVKMWNGGTIGWICSIFWQNFFSSGLDEGLLEALSIYGFSSGDSSIKHINFVRLFLPLTLIDLSETGPLNNITLVIELGSDYTGPVGPSIEKYDNYPYDDDLDHSHPVMGVSSISQ